MNSVNNQSHFLRKGCPEEQNFTSSQPEIHDLTEIEHGINKPADIQSSKKNEKEDMPERLKHFNDPTRQKEEGPRI